MNTFISRVSLCRVRYLLICLVIILWQALPLAAFADLSVADLRTEYRENPLGIDEARPRLMWRLESNERAQEQSGYRILVATTVENLQADKGDLWDTGKVDSRQTIHIEYDGQPLQSRQPCYWKVMVWDQDDVASEWSESANWSMGLLEEKDWRAKYISYADPEPIFKSTTELYLPSARHYRKEFRAHKKVKRATLYATALGIYEFQLNGQRVGDAWFAPGWTDYRQRAYYYTHDVTDLMAQDGNAIGAIVAEGWYSGYVGFGLFTGMGTEKTGRAIYGKTPAVMAQLEIEYDDGSMHTVSTDATWKVTGEGPYREADLLMGESYDARREMPGWSTVDFDDGNWKTAIHATDAGPQSAMFYEGRSPTQEGEQVEIKGTERDFGFRRPRVEAFPGNPVRVTEEIRPIEVVSRGNGHYIINLGQNFAGSVRLKVKGPTGHRIQLRYGEMLHPNGQLMTENLRKARATDSYTSKGNPNGEIYTPLFTFHGFQYVELTNFRGEADLDTITGLVLHSDTPLASTFECSDPMVNQLYSNVIWTQRANFIDLPTDCPQRDERMGWTGDAQAYIATAIYNAEVGAFYTKWFRELMEAQHPSGAFTDFAPYPFQHGHDFATAWGDAGIICPWTIWQAYDDTRILQRCWQPMTRFMQWRKKTSHDNLGVAHGNNWGDWLAQGETTPLEYIDTIYFALTTNMMADMAEALGKTNEARAYRAQFQRIQDAFGRKYLRADGSITVETQTAHTLALFADLVPGELREATGQRLAKLIGRNGNRMATGFLGTRPLLPTLTSVGQNDLAVFLLQSHQFPSWGYEIDQGATTIWERWDSYTKEDAFGRHNASMNSFSHYAFGAVCEWMFRYLAGIDTEGPGYAKIIIYPRPASPGSNPDHEPIHWVKAAYHSIRGKIVSEWKLEEDRFHLNVEIPANTMATVYMPATDPTSITESDRPLSELAQARVAKSTRGRVAIEIPSGRYHFASTGGVTPAKEALLSSRPAE